jgi:hypothetical protein
MRKLSVLLEAFALAAVTLTAISINSDTREMMVAASQIANRPQESAIGKVIAFTQAAGTVAVLTVHPQSAKARQCARDKARRIAGTKCVAEEDWGRKVENDAVWRTIEICAVCTMPICCERWR